MQSEARLTFWATARARMRKKFGDELFERWLSKITLLDLGSEQARLGVPSRFLQEWIEAKYLKDILEVLRDSSGRDLEVRLEIDPDLFRIHDSGHRTAPGLRSRGTCNAPGEPAARGGGEPGAADADDPLEPTLDNFVVGDSNELAYTAALQVVERPGKLYNPLFVHGGAGVGKSHLLKGLSRDCRRRMGQNVSVRLNRRLWSSRGGGDGGGPIPGGRRFNVRYVSAGKFFHQFVASVQDGTVTKFRERYRSLDMLVIDDIQLLVSKKKTQLEFLHTFNALVESGKQIIISSDVPPQRLVDLTPALLGRFLGGLVARIRRPDYDTRLEIVRRHAAQLRSRFQLAVLEYIAANLRGNGRELMSALMRLDVQARVNGRSLDIEAAREVLAEILYQHRIKVDLKKIRGAVAHHFGLTEEQLVSGSRQRNVVFARQVAMYLARRHTPRSLGEIGKYFGNRTHATVRCAETKVEKLSKVAGSSVARDLGTIVDALEV